MRWTPVNEQRVVGLLDRGVEYKFGENHVQS
jgi:hypothetical protein